MPCYYLSMLEALKETKGKGSYQFNLRRTYMFFFSILLIVQEFKFLCMEFHVLVNMELLISCTVMLNIDN